MCAAVGGDSPLKTYPATALIHSSSAAIEIVMRLCLAESATAAAAALATQRSVIKLQPDHHTTVVHED